MQRKGFNLNLFYTNQLEICSPNLISEKLFLKKNVFAAIKNLLASDAIPGYGHQILLCLGRLIRDHMGGTSGAVSLKCSNFQYGA